MDRLHTLSRLMSLIACYTIGSCAMVGQDQCSLVVKVRTPDGRRPEVPVTVIEANGRTEASYQEDGDVRFCDLGILPVSVKVGGDESCNQIVVHDVPLLWGESYLLNVTYDPEACDRRHGLPPPIPICRILVRVADPAGRWLSGASVVLSGSNTRRLTADRYGRASFSVKRGEDVTVVVTLGEATPMEAHFVCTASEPLMERIITLGK